MSKQYILIDWEEILNKFSLHEGRIIDFFKENSINQHQLYHRSKRKKIGT